MDNVVRCISFGARAAHTTIVSSSSTEVLALDTAEPHKYPRNAASARRMPAHALQMTRGYDSLPETTKTFKHAEERKEGEETKGAQCNEPPFQESGQENRAVGRTIHAKAKEDGGCHKRGHEYEGELRMKRTASPSFDPTHNVFVEGGTQDILPIDDASWEVIDYPTCLA